MSKELQDVQGGLFKVSKDGEVYRKTLKGYKLAKQIQLGTPKSRYKGYSVSAQLEGKQVYRYVSRLIAEAYVPNPDNLPFVYHIDGDAKNNTPSNLKWGSSKDLAANNVRLGLYRSKENAGEPCLTCNNKTLRKDRICAECLLKLQHEKSRDRKSNKYKALWTWEEIDALSGRDRSIVLGALSGETLSDLCKKWNLSRQRIHQIVLKQDKKYK